MSADGARVHFGVLSFTGSGHLNPLIALGLELQDRGHKVTFFEKPKIETRIREAGLDFHAIGRGDSPFKSKKATASGRGLLSELSTLQFNLRRIAHDVETYLRETEPAIREAGVDVLLVNEIALTGPTVAELLGIPYIVISTSVPHNFGWNAYPLFSGYKFRRSWLSILEVGLLEVSAVRMRGPLQWALNAYRARRGLRPVRGVNSSYPPLAQITQLPEFLDLPRSRGLEHFHYTGPFARTGARPQVDFPWDQLDGRPLIYASLGTTRNAQLDVLRLIAEACKDIDAQLVISLGGRFDSAIFRRWPGDPLVRRFVPQLELLKRATVVVTHAGPNTVFETLMEGKQMVAIPIAHDQPAIAARLARLGIAEVLPIMRLSAQEIREAVVKTMTEPRYREAAVKMQGRVRALRGVECAADIIEGYSVRCGVRRDLDDSEIWLKEKMLQV
jgi:zeaxanthin glucosyltransferase